VAHIVVVLANTALALALIVVAISGRLTRGRSPWSAASAALPLLAAGLLAAYVFGEDSYRGNGISRWDAYRSPGGALGPMFVLSIALMVVSAALLAYAGLRDRDRLLRATALGAGLTALFLLYPTYLGFSLN
jgi:ABC-type transport system involved in cytochrome c biogenesis permease subunit